MENIRKIDIHAHATAYPQLIPANYHTGGRFLGGDELIEMYDRLNIERGVLLPIVDSVAQWVSMTTENCKAVADAHPDRFSWFCGIDPRMGDHDAATPLAYLLNHYKALGARGVGELTTQLYADDPMMDNLFSALEECGLPVIIHIAPRFGGGYGIVDELGLPRIERMLKKHPDMTLIGHSQPFWAEISDDVTDENRNGYPQGRVREGRLVKLLRDYGNLCCDLSAGSGMNAMTRDPEFAARFMEEFSDRVFYGCDICASFNTHPFKMDAFLTRLRTEGALSEENYRKIARGNAERLLGL
ncbi:MAG: amidohydrolase family protein [Clostridia bacterium]|nr:amidohydrolase family protein [Clostridia bacterium]